MADNTKHTPPPWKAHNLNSIRRASDDRRIALVDWYGDEESKRNINVIVAAPDTLSALKHARTLIHIWHGDAGWDIYDRHSPEMRGINAAIAKAEGRMDDVIDWYLCDHWADEPPTIPTDPTQPIEEIRKSVNQFVEKIVADAKAQGIELEAEAVAKRAGHALSKGVRWWEK